MDMETDFVIPEIFYRESGFKPDSRLKHAGMTNNSYFLMNRHEPGAHKGP